MKETKLIHVVIAMILILLSLAILQWTKLPKNAPTIPESSQVTAPATELPSLPQNELYNSNSSPSFTEELPPFTESPGDLEPNGKAGTGKPML